MSEPILYRSIVDGWRVGVATNVANSSKITVDDAETGLSETVTPAGVYVPKSAELLTAPRSFYIADDDLSCLVPSPLESLPTLLHGLRCRFMEGKDGSLLGDNAFVSHKGPAVDGTHKLFAKRLVAAARASPSVPQHLTVVGDGDSFTLLSSFAEEVAIGAGSPLVAEALAAVRPFCVTSKGESLAITAVEVFPTHSAARLSVRMMDYGVLDALHDRAGLGIFGALIHGCSHEEKDACCFPTAEYDFRAHPSTLDSAGVESCRVGFLRFRKALDALGIPLGSQDAILGRVGAALQLLQIDFGGDGVLSGAVAVKNVARVLRVDFEQLRSSLLSRRHCFVLAAYLMKATLTSLVSKINEALNPAGVELPPPSSREAGTAAAPVTLSLLPSADHLGSGPRRLLVETLHEDMAQCVFRSSEREILQWQRSGFAVTSSLQHVFDTVDNYSLLKVLRGSGGVLSALSATDGQVAEVLERVGRHRMCTADPKSLTLTIRHSNDREVSYRHINSGGYPTIEEGAFGPLKQFVLSCADADCQEAFILTERLQSGSRPTTALNDLDALRAFGASMSDPALMHWWAFDVSPRDGGVFEGFFIEQALIEQRIRPFTMLRQLLPKRFLPCDPSFITKEFDALCDVRLRAQTDTQSRAESILTRSGVHYLVTRGSLLVEARSIMHLYSHLESFIYSNVRLVQSAARSRLASMRLTRRVMLMQEAIGDVMRTIETEDSRYRSQLANTDLYRVETLNLQERESVGRAAIRDACWVEWVALQTEENAAAEEAIERQVAQRIRDDELAFRSIVRQREVNALQDLAARVHERIVLQGAHLDGIVALKNDQMQGVRRQMDATRRVHDRRMGMIVSEEERRSEVQQRIARKNEISKSVAESRSDRAARLRNDTWAKHERDRLARMELQRARASIEDRMREKFVMEGIEAVVAKRVAAEVTERNKRVREAEEAAMRRERAEREREIREMERKQTAQNFRDAKIRERQSRASDSAKAKEQYRMWTVQEKERQAVLRLQKEEAKQSKKMSSALLQAHSMLSNPQLYDIHGNVRTNKSHSRHQDPGFDMADGSTSFARLLPNSTVDAVVSFHQQRSPTPYNRSRRAFSPGSDYSL